MSRQNAPAPVIVAEPGPKSATVGVPTTRPRCAIPVSGLTSTDAPASRCQICGNASAPANERYRAPGSQARTIASPPRPADHTGSIARAAKREASIAQRSGSQRLSGVLAPTCRTAYGAIGSAAMGAANGTGQSAGRYAAGGAPSIRPATMSPQAAGLGG